jgi:uncharacterized membrane protein
LLKTSAGSRTVTGDQTFAVTAMPTFGTLLWNTLLLRPYVFGFLLAFLVAAVRDLGPLRTVGLAGWGWTVAFVAEYWSTRVGIPFGLYHYTAATVGRELYLSNVPAFDPLSFVFLAYASLCLARWATGKGAGAAVALLAGVVMMLLDVVIDPLAVRGDRWFLGRIFYYPAGGLYFGVPLSNFVGWMLVGWVTVGGYLWAIGSRERAPRASRFGPGVCLYYGVLLFNLTLTAWIGEWGLLGAGILVHLSTYLLLYGLGARRRGRSPAGHEGEISPGRTRSPS